MVGAERFELPTLCSQNRFKLLLIPVEIHGLQLASIE